MIASFKIDCGCLQRKKYNICVTVQILLDLTVLLYPSVQIQTRSGDLVFFNHLMETKISIGVYQVYFSYNPDSKKWRVTVKCEFILFNWLQYKENLFTVQTGTLFFCKYILILSLMPAVSVS